MNDKRSQSTTLKIAALAGVGLSLINALATSFPLQDRQGYAFLILFLLAGAVAAALLLLLRKQSWHLLRKPALATPVGIYLLATTLVNWFALIPGIGALLNASTSANMLNIALSGSLLTLMHIALAAMLAAWQTDLLRRALEEDEPSLDPLPPIKRLFWRMLAALVIGVAAGFLFFGLGATILQGAIVLLIVGIGLWTLLWNTLTFALIPVITRDKGALVATLKRGFRRSWELKWRWWKPLLAQLALCGILVFVSVSFTKTTSTGFHTQRNTATNVNLFWLGGYHNDSKWYEDTMAKLETPTLPIASHFIGLLFFVLALSIKLKVLEELRRDDQGAFELDHDRSLAASGAF